jgi:hypothetical protein
MQEDVDLHVYQYVVRESKIVTKGKKFEKEKVKGII